LFEKVIGSVWVSLLDKRDSKLAPPSVLQE